MSRLIVFLAYKFLLTLSFKNGFAAGVEFGGGEEIVVINPPTSFVRPEIG